MLLLTFDLSPVHTSDIVAKSRDIVAKNGNNIEATLSKQLLVFNPVAMPSPKVQKYGSGDGSIQWRPRAEPL